MAADKVKDKSRARLKERQKVIAPAAAHEDKEKSKSAFARNIQRQKNEQAAAKKAAPKNAPAQPQEKKGGLLEYLRGVRIETKKVVWPTRKELVNYTIVVFIACAFFGLFLWGVDSGFLAIIREVFDINMVTDTAAAIV
ncbi:MAG: preprotein translocase subunit SecE [Clostridiales Family XIII bacterium]|jgi:preprotein translocase subunit SecE|nr:preprotein translocase subunit SecE [Clostridiales Family XIII bacterium]